MYFATAALLVTTGVVFLCGASEGCYNNFQTCNQQNAAIAQTAMSGPSFDITAYCSGLQSVQTCLNTDTADCTSGPPPEVLLLKTMIDNSTRDCVAYNQLSSMCKGKVSECTNIAVAMAKNISTSMIQAGSNSSSLGTVFTLLCPILKSTQTCFQETQTMCPEAKSIIPMGQFETQLTPFCGSGSSGASLLACGLKQQECSNCTLMAYNKLPQSGQALDPTLMAQFCEEMPAAVGCYNETMYMCPSIAAAMVQTVKQYSSMVQMYCVTSSMAACYAKQQECSNRTQMAYNKLPQNNQLRDPTLMTQFCEEMPAAVGCYNETVNMCPSMATAMVQTAKQYSSMVQMYCGTSSLLACGLKQQECSNLTLMAYNKLLQNGQALDPTLMTQFCEEMPAAVGCYNETMNMCPSIAAAMARTVKQYSSMVQMNCGTSSLPACGLKQQECNNLTLMAVNKLPQSGQALDPTLMTQFCEEMPAAVGCYNETMNMCPSIAAAMVRTVKQYSSMVQMYCGTSSACRTTNNGCMDKFIETCINGGTQGSFEQEQACCRISEEMFQCLDKAGCPDSMLMGSRSLMKLQASKMCQDYTEYCPGVEICWSNVSSLEELCPKTEAVFTCIETKCANTATQNPPLSKMKPLITEICAGLQTYPAISACYPFGICTGSTVTTLPGTVQSLRSMASAGSSEHWCRFAKGVSSCTSQVAKSGSCSIGGNFTTDVAALKSSIDSTCLNVRDPCPAALVCLSKLQRSNLSEICREIPGFVKCVDAALATCGEASKVKAKYSLNDVSLKFVRFCTVVSNNAEVTNCAGVQPCMVLPQHTDTASSLSDLTDQTYWAKFLEGMARCTADAGVSCKLTQSTTQEMTAIYTEVKALSGEKNNVNDSDGDDKSGTTVVSSLLFLFVTPVLIFFKLN